MDELIVSDKINSLISDLKEVEDVKSAVAYSNGYLGGDLKPNAVFKAEDVKVLFDVLFDKLLKS